MPIRGEQKGLKTMHHDYGWQTITITSKT